MSTRPPSAAVAQQSPGIRASYGMFVARHEVAWELFFSLSRRSERAEPEPW